jgi:aminopeptidase I
MRVPTSVYPQTASASVEVNNLVNPAAHIPVFSQQDQASARDFFASNVNVTPPPASDHFVHSERVTRSVPKTKVVDPYTQAFIDFIYENPTTYHAAEYFADELTKAGFTYISERVSWKNKLTKSGKYFTTRNGSSLVAFVIGANYTGGNGAGMIACHIDALTAKVKPISKKPVVEGYTQLGTAPYAGAMSM